MAIQAADTGYSVTGKIFFDYGLPARELSVRAYHRGFGCRETLLGEGKSGDDGFYSIAYEPKSPLVNLEVRAVDEKGEEVSISGTRYGASNKEVLNLVAPAKVRVLLPEYDRLRHDLTDMLRETGTIAEAHENSRCQDITLLHRATKWDARLITLLAIAARLSRETNLNEEVVYGALRSGLPKNKELLAQVSVTAFGIALQKAVKANIVSLNDEQIAAARQAFEQFARATRRATKARGGLSSLGELLDQSGLTAAEKTTFETLYLHHDGTPGALWTKATDAGIPKEKIATLQLQGKLAYLTLNNAPLAAMLGKEIESIEKLGSLVEHDLYKPEAWKKLLLETAEKSGLAKLIPPAYTGDTTEKRLDAYASDLARKVRASLPTQVVARMIETDELDLGAKHSTLKAPVNTVLKKADALGFALGHMPVNKFISENHAELFQGINADDVEPTTKAFKQLHRLYQITPTNEALQFAMKEGFGSAADVAATPYEAFMKSHGDKFAAEHGMSMEVADIFYRKAQQVASTTYNFFVAAKQMETSPTVYAISPPAGLVESAKSELIKHYPTMESLFGSLDFCECDSCRSVLSPAAYLVDLLQFLNPAEPAWNSFLSYWKITHNGEEYTDDHLKAYDALVERRPDIPHLPLTCENTHTVLPYIDVVNEILEFYVAEGSLDPEAVHDTGNASSADLLAEPQHILKEAYDTLKDAKYPIGLPFDLWLETVRGFCDQFGIPLWQVLDLFRSTETLFKAPGDPEPYDMSAIFLEYLGISSAESSMITNGNPLASWHLLYGFDDPSKTTAQNQQAALAALASAKTLSRQLGVTYKQIVELVKTGFVNPKLDALVILQKLGVTVSDVFTYKNNEHLFTENTLTQEEAALLEELKAFKARLDEMSASFPGFNAINWLNQSWQQDVFDKILVLADPDTGCNFDLTTLRYADGTNVDAIALIKLNLFVRLWKKLGWTIEETDRALQTFLPSASSPLTAANLGQSLKTALMYLAQFKRLEGKVKVGSNRRLKLLTLWSTLPTTGTNPLYAQLFLSNSALQENAVFDHPLGNYLQSGASIGDHMLALQAALSLTANEITSILADSGQQTELTLENVSMLYRYGLLAKALKLSVQELITLKSLSGLNPFKPLEAAPLSELDQVYPFTQTLRFVDIATAVKESGFRVEDLDYFFRHHFDPVGKYQQKPEAVLSLVQTLAYDLQRIRDEQTISGSLTDDQLRQKCGVLLPPDMLTAFFAAITNTSEAETSESPVQVGDKLDAKSFSGEPRIRVSYHEVETQQRLAWRGLLLNAKKTELEAANSSPLLANLLGDVQPLGFSFLATQIETVLSSLLGTTEYHAVIKNVTPAAQLDPEAFKDEPSIRVAYDEAQQIQHLTWRGLLLNAKKTELNNAVNSPVLVQLLDSVQSQVMAEAAALIRGSLSLLIATLEFHAVEPNVQLADKLDATKFGPRFSVTYDEAPAWDAETEYETADVVSFNGANWSALQANTGVAPVNGPDWGVAPGRMQALSVRGLVSQAKITELLAAHNQSPVLIGLLAAIQNQVNAFIQQLRVGLFSQSDFNALFADLPGLSDAPQDPRARLATAVVPFIVRHLSAQLIVQTLSSHLDANPDLIEALLTDGSLLVDPSEPGSMLMDAFASAGDKGTSASFFDSLGDPVEIKVVSSVDTVGKPATASGARFEGYLQVPSSGPYRFFAFSESADSELELRLGDLPDPLLRAKAETVNAEFSAFVELKQNLPNVFTFDVRNLNGGHARLFVQGEKLPKGTLSQLDLSPSQSVERVRRAAVLLKKVLALINGLALTEREVRHLLTHASDFGSVSLNKLPTGETSASPDAVALFDYFLRLVQYTNLKRDVAGETDDLIGIFHNARRSFTLPADANAARAEVFDDLCRRFAELTRREFDLVHEAATMLGFTAVSQPTADELLVSCPAFAQVKQISRLWDVLRAAEQLGVSLDAIVNSTEIIDTTKTQAERFAIATNLRKIVKARYETENWRRIAQPIFDKLRQRQRDALVAWIMHRDNFERIEQLFEFFLIDPGMEPVVQTSRLRLAISSVQLFIQRALLNLELKVHPSSINSRHWEWMKRYRVWEANRKIFLFPENWLEPEFRDDKTHLFKELEGALMEGDVSQDLVEAGFYNYLRSLEELAKLDVVAVYTEEKPLDPASNVVHVVGRTANLPHKYFYRRYQHRMWTPWEPMGIEVDGNHMVLVMWRQRLHLFWVTFIEKAKEQTDGSSIELDFDDSASIPKTPPRRVDIQLNWSEYYQGQWTTREASGYAAPVTVDIAADFKKRDVFIFFAKEYDASGEEKALRIQLSGELNLNGYGTGEFTGGLKWKTAFRVISKLSAPEVAYREPNQPTTPPYTFDTARSNRYHGSDKLQVTFFEKVEEDGPKKVYTSTTDEILREVENNFSVVIPGEVPRLVTPEFAPLISPFFFQDTQHTFFVEPTLEEKTFVEWDDWVLEPQKPDIDLDDIVLIPKVPEWVDPGGPVEFDPLSVFEMEFQTDWVNAPQTLLQFDEAWIGNGGGVNVQMLPAMDMTALDTITNIDSTFLPGMIDGTGFNRVALNRMKSNLNESMPAVVVGKTVTN